MQYYVFSTHLFFADCLLKIFELHFFGKIHEAFKLYEILNFLFEKKTAVATNLHQSFTI